MQNLPYIVNKNAQPGGEHEVHVNYGEGSPHECPEMPLPKNWIDLGFHADCHSAVIRAKDFFPTVDGCKLCSLDCHTK